jgi:hypothetical protein
MRVEVLTAVTITVTFSCDETSCYLEEIERFGGSCRNHQSFLMMEAADFYKRLVYIYQTARRHMPEGRQ